MAHLARLEDEVADAVGLAPYPGVSAYSGIESTGIPST